VVQRKKFDINSTLNERKITQTYYTKWLSICSGYCEFNAT